MSLTSSSGATQRRHFHRNAATSSAKPVLSTLSLLLVLAFSASVSYAGGGAGGGTVQAGGGRDSELEAGSNGSGASSPDMGGGGGGAGMTGGRGGNVVGIDGGGAGGATAGAAGADGEIGVNAVGGGGGGGGAHGYVGVVSGLMGSVEGGRGGNGGNAQQLDPMDPVGSSGGGGAGGVGAVLSGAGTNDGIGVDQIIRGGNGGRGGSVITAAHAGNAGPGNGGSGGAGVQLIQQNMTLNVYGTVQGGDGGNGGPRAPLGGTDVGGIGGVGGSGIEATGGNIHVQSAGQVLGGTGGSSTSPLADLGITGASQGGHGIHIQGGTISNQNLIAGGNAGASNADEPGASGGIGVIGTNLVIINRGTIRGGLNGNGTTRALSVLLLGGSNSLQLGAMTDEPARFEGGIHLAGGMLAIGGEGNQTLVDPLRGNGALRVVTNLRTTAMHGFSGTVDIASGSTLQLDGSFVGASLLTVESGATLAGSGNAGNTLVKSGGFIAPGPGVSTLRILGDLTMEEGSTYRVKVTPQTQTGDYLKVSGKATLAGTALHVGPESAFDVATTHTILSASEIVGGFTTVKSDYAYLTASLTQVENDINMKLERRQVEPDVIVHPGKPKPTPDQSGGGTRPIRFSDLANSPNQSATGNALETLPASSPLYKTVLTLPTGTPADALAQLSGDSHATAGNAMVNGGSLVRTLPVNPLRNNLVAPMLPGAPTAAAGASDAAPSGSVLPRSAAQPAWAQVYGSWQRLSGHDGSADARQRTGGVFVGADHELGKGWRVGGALGFGTTDMTVNDRSAKNDIASYSATLYGGKAFDGIGPGKLVALGGVGYTWYDVTSKRQVNLPGLSESLQADYGAGLAQVFGEIGYALAINPKLTLEPFAGVAWSDLRRRSFTEEGGISALSSDSQKQDLTTTTLGLRARSALQFGARDVSLSGTLGWRHTFGGRAVQSRMAFQGSEAFTVAGAPVAQDTALVELGASVAVGRNASAGLAYNGEFGGGNREHAGMVRLRWGF